MPPKHSTRVPLGLKRRQSFCVVQRALRGASPAGQEASTDASLRLALSSLLGNPMFGRCSRCRCHSGRPGTGCQSCTAGGCSSQWPSSGCPGCTLQCHQSHGQSESGKGSRTGGCGGNRAALRDAARLAPLTAPPAPRGRIEALARGLPEAGARTALGLPIELLGRGATGAPIPSHWQTK